MVERAHRALHLGEDLARVGVVPVEAEAAGELLDDPPVRPRLAGQRHGGAAELDLAVGVGDGAVLLGPGRGGQDHVGELRGLGDEEVLHDQVLEPGERGAGVVEVGVGHRRVLAQDVHAAHLSGGDRVHGLDHGEAGLGGERRRPQLLEGGAVLRVAHRAVVGQHHRDEAGIRGALHVVLPAQRVQAGAGAADVAGGERERDQAARVVGAVHMLRDAHAPEDHRAFGVRIQAGDVADLVRRHAAQRRHGLGRHRRDVGGERLEALGARGDEVAVAQALADDDVEHGVEERDVAPRREAHHAVGVLAEHQAARVEHDQLGAALGGLLEPGGGDGVVHRRVAAGEDDHVGLRRLHEGGGDRARADALHQRGDRAGVAQPGAVVDVVGAEAGAHQLLEQPGLLVRALRAAEAGEHAGAVGVEQAAQAGGGEVERLVPACRAEVAERAGWVEGRIHALGRARATDQRGRQAAVVVGVVEAEAALDAQAVLVGRAVAALDEEDALVPDVVGELAAHAAVGAHRIHLALGAGRVAAAVRVDQAGRHQRARGAGLHALAAGHAAAVAHRVVEVEHDRRARAAVGEADDVVHLHLAAGAHAQAAGDAGVECDVDGGVGAVGRAGRGRVSGRVRGRRGGQPHLLDQFPEMAGAVRAVRARRLVLEQQFEHPLARLPGARRARAVHHHPRPHFTDAGGGEGALALDLDHAGAAVAVAAIAGGVLEAQVGDALAGAQRDLPQGFAGEGLHRNVVQRDLEGSNGRLPQAGMHRVLFL